MNTLPFMPDETLVHIFKYLRVEDINSCRLVCQRWYSCADVWSIRKSEQYVFHIDVLPTIEINDILVNHKGAQISVKFIGVKLDELHFEEFGAKIRALEIDKCFFHSLTNIFLSTPNMKCFIYRYENHCGKKQLRDLAVDLHKNDAVIRNLEKLDCFSQGNTTVDFSEPFASVFPRLTSITLPSPFCIINESLKCLLIQNNVTELRNVYFPPLGYYDEYYDENEDIDLCLQYDTIKLLPRFTKLEIKIDLTLDLCLELFSQQSCLETLEIHVFVHKDCSNTESEKQLLLHLLKNCKRLKILHFFLENVIHTYLHFNHTDMQLFKEVIARNNSIIDLEMPPITIDGSTSAKFFALFNGLKYLNTGKNYDAHSENPTKNFLLHTLREELVEIIKSQQCLERLKLNAGWSSWAAAESVTDFNYNLNVEHLWRDRLEHLKLDFQIWTVNIVQTIIMWEFPNLSTLVLNSRPPDDWVELAELNLEDKNRFIDWILSMPSLKAIHLHWFDLNGDQYLSMCRNLPNLETISCKALEAPSKNKIKMIFADRRALKKVEVDVKEHQCQYVINRSKNIIYFRKSVTELCKLCYVPWE